MNSDILKGKWKQLKGSAQKEWGELTENDLDQVNGELQELVGVIQERYGASRDEAQKQVDDWFKKHDIS